MASKINLDLRNFKHEKSDKNSTTLRHKTDGHSITLAHNSLSPEAQVQLKSLAGISKQDATPDQTAQMRDQKMAHGGKAMYAAGGSPYDDASAGGHVPTGNDPSNQTKQQKMHDAASGSKKNETDDFDLNKTIDTVKSWFKAQGGEACLACGGKVSHYDDGGKVPAPSGQSSAPAPPPTEHPTGANVNTPSSISDAMSRIKNAWAQGGEINPKLEQSRQVPPSNSHLERPEQGSNTLNYPQLKKEYAEKNKTNFVQGSRKRYADGGGADQEVNDNENFAQMLNGFDPNAPMPAIPPSLQSAGRGAPQMQDSDPERATILPALAQSSREVMKPYGADTPDWLKNPEDKAPAITQINPADIAANKADAVVTNLDDKKDAAEDLASAAHQQAANQAGKDMSPEGLISGGLQAERAGAIGQANAVGQRAQAESGALQQGIQQQQDLIQAHQKAYDDLEGERQAHISDIQKGYIDPNKYWTGDENGKGGHSKILTGIGMILAGFNPTNRPNAAIEFLNHQMDNNLKAQEQNLNSKNNLLQANLHQFKNMQDATDMTRLMQADAVKYQLQKSAADSASPMAKAQAQSAIGSIDAKYAPLMMQMQIRHMMQGLGSGGTSAPGSTGQLLSGLDQLAPEQSKGYRERYYAPYDVPGGKSIADRPIAPGDRTSLQAYDKFDSAARNLHQLIQAHKGNLDALSPVQRNAAAQQAMVLQSLFREGTLGTVYKSGEQPLLDKAIDGQPLGLVHYFTELPKLEGLMKSNQSMKDTTLEGYGLKPPHQVQQQQQQANPSEGQTGTLKNGTRVKMINGKWTKI